MPDRVAAGVTVEGGPRPASRFLTAVRLQAIEYGHVRGLLAIVLVLPIAFFLMTYYGTPASAPAVDVIVPQASGTAMVTLPQRTAYSQAMGIMGVGWAVATLAFFAVMGNLQRDRRLVLSGYAAWQILLARLAILAGISLPLALVAMVPATVVMPADHPEVVLLADFCGGLIAAGFGILVGTLLPRATEGVLVIVLVIGTGMALSQDLAKYFFLDPAIEMLISGRLADHPAVLAYVWPSALLVALFLAPSLALWWRRTRIIRHPALGADPVAGQQISGSIRR